MASLQNPGDYNEAVLRKRSVGNIELQDSKGRRRTVQLEDLTDADRELAEKFGYKPVCEASPTSRSDISQFSASTSKPNAM